MKFIKDVSRTTFKLCQKKIRRILPMICGIVVLTYLLTYSSHEDDMIVGVRKKQLGINLEVTSPSVNDSQLSVTTDNTTIGTTPIPVNPAIHFPLDIDLKQSVKDKIEKNIDVPAKPINEHNFKYIHKPLKCEFANIAGGINMLILVKSGVRNVFLRNGIRDTWGENLAGNIKLRFMLGYSVSHVETSKREAETYNDIILENFVDAYPNNTLKTIMGFNWAVTECASARIILFLDDDHLPHVNNIMTHLRSLNDDDLDSLFLGYRIDNGKIYKGRHHWAIPRNVYPYKTWAPYLRGGAYIVSQKNAKKFAVAFPFVQYLHVDDGYLGVVALKLGIEPQHDDRFVTRKRDIMNNKASFVYNDYKHPHNLKMGWKVVKNAKS
ncbi:beta-1,3-galactosyltransferase 1-like [Argopecten irradians]|uniref:beta-1,3-galactosyltransferase 1-like n=1 Tax=Argopecten irradians TaxID=31199 RepID=UPI0037206D3F